MKISRLFMLLLMLVLFVSACSPNVSNEDELVGETPNEVEPEVETPTGPKDDPIPATIYKSNHPVNFDFIQIYDQFMEEHSGAQVREFELSLKNSGYVYQIEATLNQEELESKYDAASGSLIKLDREPFVFETVIFSREDVKLIPNFLDLVMTEVGKDFFLKELVLQEDNGKKVIEIEVVDDKNHDIEYKYDLTTQELIEIDQ